MQDLAIIEDGALLIQDGVIQEVGPTRRIERLREAQDAEVIDATGRVVMPGFVDCSTDLLEATKMGARSWTNARLELEAAERLRWCIRHGTTTLEAKASNAQDLKVLLALNTAAFNLVPTLLIPNQSKQSLSAVKNWIPRICVDCSQGDLFPDAVVAYLQHLKTSGVSTHMQGGSVSLALKSEVHTWSHPDFSPEEIPDVAASKIITVVQPLQQLQKRGLLRKLIDQGAAVAFATGFSGGIVRTISMSLILSLARFRLQMTDSELIIAATINSAHALGLATIVGSLEAGKQADLIMLNINNYRDLATYPGVNLIAMTMKRGKILVYEKRASLWK